MRKFQAKPHFFALLLGSLTLLATAPVQALEDWQLQYGPFITASDVRPHNQLPQDIADMQAALAESPPDFATALSLYAFGKNFPWRDRTHSLGRFNDDYNRAMPAVVPESVAHFGSSQFANQFMFSALAGTNRFQGVPDALRIAAIEGGALASVVNWTRFELVMSERKALAENPNWALTNGSPKNWNEIFAFHWGPEGQHSVHAALQALDGGSEVNTNLYAILARGQEPILQQTWPADDARHVAQQIHIGSLLLFQDAVQRILAASDAAQREAQFYAQGLWLAAAEPILMLDAGSVALVESALTQEPDAGQLEMVSEVIDQVLAALRSE